MSEEGRLRWLCRRGMRELDVLLTRYLLDRYPQTSDTQKSAFQELLKMETQHLTRMLGTMMIPDLLRETVLAG